METVRSRGPRNWITGTLYQGKNVGILLEAQAIGGFPTAEWSGYGQAKRAGFPVRKGETAGARILRVVTFPPKTEDGPKRRGLKQLVVFNRAQLHTAESLSE